MQILLKTGVLALLLVANASAGTPAKGVAETPTGDYLGQKRPGAVPEVFAPGIVSSDGQEHMAPAFSPDGNEVFWLTHNIPGAPKKTGPDFALTSRRVHGHWSAPSPSPFDGMLAFSPDGRRIYFNSYRPCPAAPGKTQADIWFSEKQGTGWSEPKCLAFVARYPALQYATAPSIARNGTLYFLSAAPGPSRSIGIYRAAFVNGEYAKPELLPASINMPDVLNWMSYVAPDDSFLLFSSNRPGTLDLTLPPKRGWPGGDIYISRHQKDGSWSEAVNLSEPVNSTVQERIPGMSPDGKYLFFIRPNGTHDEDVYWVDATTIPALRPR